MEPTKVYEFAKELGLETIALMDKIKAWKLPVKSHMSSLDEDLQKTIIERLEEESSSQTKKKTVKKKVAKKKKATTTAKKKASKTVVKKAITKKTITKKTEDGEVVAKTTTTKKKKVVKKKAGVIRRKAGEPKPEETLETLKTSSDMGSVSEATMPEASSVEAADHIAPSETQASEEKTSSEVTAATETSPAPTRGRNIIGRIDLSKVSKKPSVSEGRMGAKGASDIGPRPTGAAPRGPVSARRGIRAGFVAPAMPEPQESRRGEVFDKTPKKKPGAKGAGGTEGTQEKSFTSADFRKREVIFQPKKKRSFLANEDMKKTQITTPKASKRIVKMHDHISVADLADQMKVKSTLLIKKLLSDGVMANLNTMLDKETVELIVSDYNFEVQSTHFSEDDVLDQVAWGDLEAEPVSRPPVVTVMGHVDHGKTTLLDAIRNARVASGEAGGITQHIGAYSVTTKSGHVVTFIDTPGHEAFTAMRARGANVTDVAVIVVAADDGVMPQTVEAINHAKAAGVPIIVAVNKMDKEGANPDRIKQQLTEYEIVPEDWGGDTIFCPVSALKGEGIDEILEQIHLVAEVQELNANPARSGYGIVIESRLEKGRGSVATLLVQDGTVNVGQIICAGKVVGRIRDMKNDRGQNEKSIGPGYPVEVTGFNETPNAGDRFDICKNEEDAKLIVDTRMEAEKQAQNPNAKMTLEEIFSKVKNKDQVLLPIVLKADVAGSIEAIKGSFDKIVHDEVKINVIHSAVGGISESDVLLASTSGGMIIGFNVRADSAAQNLAKERKVDIKYYNIIYELLDDVKKALSGLLAPDEVEKDLGRAEVRQTFSVPKVGTVAGCFVIDGKILRNAKVRLVRDGRQIYEGELNSLKRFKDDAKEVASGYECGMGIQNYNDIKVGDIIEAYEVEQVERSLE